MPLTVHALHGSLATRDVNREAPTERSAERRYQVTLDCSPQRRTGHIHVSVRHCRPHSNASRGLCCSGKLTVRATAAGALQSLSPRARSSNFHGFRSPE